MKLMEPYVTSVPIANKFLVILKVDKKEIGNYQFATFEELTLVLWYDCRAIYVLSSMHSRSVETILKRPKGDKENLPSDTQ